MRTPRVTRVETNAREIGRFEKFEITFEIERAFPRDSFLPYYFFDADDARGIDGITIDAEFRAPSGAILSAPAFYFVEHKRWLDWRGRARIEPTGKRVWKIRFAPRELGMYAYRIFIRDKHGVTQFPERAALEFTCAPCSCKGFIRVSPRDAHFLEFENGEPFLPVSAAQQWWNTHAGQRSFQYERAFEIFRAHGINFTRVWDQCDGWALTVEGPFDGYDGFQSATGSPEAHGKEKTRAARIANLPRGTQMNQRGNFEEDLIFESAERNGVYIQLCSVGDPKWIWDVSTHDTRDNAIHWNPHPVAFDDAAHLNYWKRNFRYRVARWGYSTALAAWETWNEHGDVAADSDILQFYQAYGAYQRATDLYAHLRTTSQQSAFFSPALWNDDAFDIATYHDYMMSSRQDDERAHDAARFVYETAKRLRTSCPDKPIVWSELDTGTTEWNEPNPQPRAMHVFLWAGLFSPLGMAPIDWYWEAQMDRAEKYAHAQIAADFFREMDFADAGMQYLCTDDVAMGEWALGEWNLQQQIRETFLRTVERVATTHPDLRVLALRARDGRAAYAWAQHRATRRYDCDGDGAPLNAEFILPKMARGNFQLEYWNTSDGAITRTQVTTDEQGKLVIPIHTLTRDVAVKILEATHFPLDADERGKNEG